MMGGRGEFYEIAIGGIPSNLAEIGGSPLPPPQTDLGLGGKLNLKEIPLYLVLKGYNFFADPSVPQNSILSIGLAF